MSGAAWDRVDLRHGELRLRPITYGDKAAWRAIRERNAAWLAPWEATRPPEDEQQPLTFRGMVRELRRNAKEGRSLPLVMEVGGALAGQVTVNNIVRGSARFASIGYWIDQRVAGRGYMPAAVAMVIDHCFEVLALHRVEVAIRPENTASLRVVEKLGLAEFGYAPRFLHIDGDWRDHRLFAVAVEDVPDGVLTRYLARRSQESQQ